MVETNKKILVTICILAAVIILILSFHLLHKPIAKKQLIQRFSEFKVKYQEKKKQGLDVSEAEKWIRKAKQAFKEKDYGAASRFLDKAFETLEKAGKLLFPSFPVVKSNSWITDPVTLRDFVPFGGPLVKLPDNRIAIDRKKGWTASNFVSFGMCTDGSHIVIFHSSVNIGGGFLRLMFDDKRLFRKVTGASYYDISGKFLPHPTVHTNPVEDYVITIGYDEETRTWYHKVIYMKTSPPTEILNVKGKGRLIPLWIGKPEGPFIVHGVSGTKAGQLCLDTWGGYLDFEKLTRCVYHDLETGETYNFTSGFTFMDREYHRNLPIGLVTIKNGIATDGVEFDAMSFHKIKGEEIEFIFLLARNPLPGKLKETFEFPEFEHTGRINFVSRGESYRFDDYIFSTDGKLQPNVYYLKGNFTDANKIVVGNVNLTAEAFAFWGWGGTENWGVHKAWWDPGGKAAWGRSFVKWRGTVTLRNETIKVEGVYGFGEFYRYKPGSLRNS